MEKTKEDSNPWRAGKRDVWRNHLVAMTGEFCGTFLFLFYAFSGTQIAVNASKPLSPSSTDAGILNVIGLLYISFAFGGAVAVNVWAFYRVSGAHFNPAITLGLCLIKAVPVVRGLLLFPCQVVAAIAAAGVVDCLFPGKPSFGVSLGGNTSVSQGLFIEMFLTIQLVFVVFMLAVEKHKATYLAPLAIGIALFITQMTGVYFTGAGVNPARSFAPAVISGFTHYQWIYWLGPIMGSFVAAAFYYLFKWCGYETANPGQDAGSERVCLLYNDEETAMAANGTSKDLSRFIQHHGKSSQSTGSSPQTSQGPLTDDGHEDVPKRVTTDVREVGEHS